MRVLACKQRTGRELLQTRSLVADGSGVTTGQPEVKIPEKKLLKKGDRKKTQPKTGQKPEANDEQSDDFHVPTFNLPSDGVFMVKSGHQPEGIPEKP